MKVLFLVFHGFADYNGISKKIYDQVDALRNCGVEVDLCYLTIDVEGNQKRMVGERVLANYGSGFMAKLKKRICYGGVLEYIRSTGIGTVYMRYDHNANPFLIGALWRLRRRGVQVMMEIPTWPYDREYEGLPFSFQLKLWMDQCFRVLLARQVYRIVTFSGYDRILGVPAVNISNGINFSRIRMKGAVSVDPGVFHLTGVADIHIWHGFDRVIEGLAAYYRGGGGVSVYFHVVGGGVPAVLADLRERVRGYGLEERVIFHGMLSGGALDEVFEGTDMGVASLARHRSGITVIKTLKNREYAARGIPFVYSETDDDFDGRSYVLKAPADDGSLDIGLLLDFFRRKSFSPEEIRGSIVGELSWERQMEEVVRAAGGRD